MINKEVDEYIKEFTTPENELMKDINRQTHLKTYYPNMLSGHVQGKFLEMISLMIAPRRILEVGTFTGYSALAMAKGLVSDGKLITIDMNEELEEMVSNFFRNSAYAAKIELHMGNALEIIPKLDETFDIVFIDADKEQYVDYYEMAIQKLRPGGYIIADNVLWGGKVLNSNTKADKETKGIKAFNAHVKNDPRVEQVMLTIRDGLLLIRKN